MSDLTAAAAALGLPEPLVERSAAARASETGASVEEVLAQWAGGEAAPAPAPAEAPADEPAPAEEPPVDAAGEAATPEVVIEMPETPASPPDTASVPAGPYKPPVLVGTKDNPMTVLAGIVGLFLIVVMVGLVGPSIPTDSPGARTSDIVFTEDGAQGRDVYAATGCAACHTQMVRPVVADVGLGPVTLNDTNQILGTRRFGPDLSDVGSRVTPAQIEAIVNGLGDHPDHNLGAEDMTSLVVYLSESATSAPEEAGS